MIVNIQLLRGLAALAVAFYHTSYQIPPYGLNTHFNGVAVFFVISGFVMAYIKKDDSVSFIKNRFARIVPFYWIVSGAMVVLACTGLLNPPYTIPTLFSLAQNDVWHPFRWLGGNFMAAMTPAEIDLIIKTALFIPMPMDKGPALGVGWSLNLEVFYYLSFGLAMAISRKYAPLIVAAFLIALQLLNGLSDNFYWKFYTSYNNGYFVSGIFLYYVWNWLGSERILRWRSIAIPVGLAMAAIYVWMHVTYNLYYLSNPLIPLGLVFSALLLHSANLHCSWRPMIILGEASYSLYLVHLIVLEAMRPIGAKWPEFNVARELPAAALAVAVSVLLALVLHYAVEKPLVRGVHRLLDRARKAPEPALQTN